MLGFIRNNQSFRKTKCLKTLYYSRVRPTSDFRSIIWTQNLFFYLNDFELV